MDFEMLMAERIIDIKYLTLLCKESMENSFVVFFVRTDSSILVNGYGWSDNMRKDFIKRYLEYHGKTNYTIVQNENIFFVVMGGDPHE